MHHPLILPLIHTIYKEQAEASEGDFKALERMRTMAMQARAATDVSVATLQAYYAQVDRLHGIFPINPDHIRVAFTWHDAFRPTKKSTEMDLNFERAGVLFNMGAVKSNIAASADRTSAEGVKLACREFQLAAGLFKHLRERVVSQLNCSLPSELTQEGLLMVENIMLAQVRTWKGGEGGGGEGKAP
jgi:programmed cell death 6-interacting protein